MSLEMFRKHTQHVEGKHIPAYRVTCSKCDAFEDFRLNSHTGTMAPELVAKRFRNNGWFIPSLRRHDLCPKCCNDDRKTKPHYDPPNDVVRSAILAGVARELDAIRKARRSGGDPESLERRMSQVERTLSQIEENTLAEFEGQLH
jgi:hypothetical protein